MAAKLAKATTPDSELIANEVKIGISQCWHVKGYGYLVTRLELDPVRTLVIVAAQGHSLKTVTPLYDEIAKANNAKLIRMHSRRAGMVRMLKPFGYEVEYGFNENIFYKKVA